MPPPDYSGGHKGRPYKLFSSDVGVEAQICRFRMDSRPLNIRNATLPDLLERVLDRGIMVHADVIISLAGIPLIGINLRAAIAGMETMVRYGVMEGWDREVRGEKRRELGVGSQE